MNDLRFGKEFINKTTYRFTGVVFLCGNTMLKSDNLLCVANGEL